MHDFFLIKMNNKGQTLGIAIVTTIFVFAIGIIAINFLMPEVTNARVALNCSDATISDGTKLLCLVFDSVVPYWIWLVISVSIGLIIARLNL